MIENILTNYNIKFKTTQLDHDTITKSKFYYKIYNNKISEPLHKFWFSVPNIKYSNNYSDYNAIRFLMNNKNETIQNLINYIKDMGTYLVEKFNPYYENLSIDFPWKEYEQYPYIFTFFTNNSTLFVDYDGNELDYNTLNMDLTYSIIFEISTIRVVPIKLDDKESNIIKINLVLVLIKQDEKKDLKKYLFAPLLKSNLSNVSNISNNMNSLSNSEQKKLPFLSDISNDFTFNKKDIKIEHTQNQNQHQHQNQHQISSNGGLIINSEQILKALNGLKKVNKDKEIIEENEKLNDDNVSQVKSEYIEKKNNLKKVKTKEKSLLKNLKKKSEKEKEKEKKERKLQLELELEQELEQELELELELELKLEKELEKELERELEKKL
jgi:hypothetical protein